MPDISSAPDAPMFHSSTRLVGFDPKDAMGFIEAEAEEHGFLIEHDESGVLCVTSPFGVVRISTEKGVSHLSVQGASADMLYAIQENIIHHLGELSEELSRQVEWSSPFTPGDYPPNFRKLTIASLQDIGPCFRRVRLEGQGLERFAEADMHFRLLLPAQEGADFGFPVIGENGQTVWPGGMKNVHRPVYTIRRIDAAAGWLEFDVFLHEGGRATDWVKSTSLGADVGLTGPGGGRVPETEELLIGGDETAIPAISHILEELPSTARGDAFLMVEDASAILELNHPQGITLHWILRRDGSAALGEAFLSADIERLENPYVWFASEKSETAKVRKHVVETWNVPAEQRYIAAYWSR